jgi:hypothetical protein
MTKMDLSQQVNDVADNWSCKRKKLNNDVKS